MQRAILPISKLVGNKGQIEGLPKNPRIFEDERFEALVKSLEDDPEYLEIRELVVFPFNDKYVVIAGNFRLKAIKKIGKMKDVPCKILDASTPVEKLRAYAIKDNVSFGKDNMKLLEADWDKVELQAFGFDAFEIEKIEEAKPRTVTTTIETTKEVCPTCGK